MNNIQTDAFIYALRNKKLKATQVTDILKNLASQAKDSETYDNLVKLYSYFVNKPVYTSDDFKWLRKAVSDCEYKMFIMNPFYMESKGAFYATDGYRLHIVEVEDYTEGYYDKNLNKIEVSYEFPDVLAVIPGKRHKAVIPMTSFMLTRSKSGDDIYEVEIGSMKVTFNAKFINELGQHDNLTVYYNDENNFHQPFLFELGNKRSAVIMPRRCEAW
jgi:hypothetical protein